MRETNPGVLKYTQEKKKKKPKTLGQQFMQMFWVSIIIVIMLGVVSYAVNADETAALDGDIEIKTNFYNSSNNDSILLDIEIEIDIDGAIEDIVIIFEKIEVQNTTEKESQDFEIEINLATTNNALIFDKVDNVQTQVNRLVNGTCEGKSCFEAYHTCITQKNLTQLKFDICDSNLVNETKDHNTTSNALIKEKSRSRSLSSKVAELTPEEGTGTSGTSGDLLALVTDNIIIILIGYLILAYVKKWFPFKKPTDSTDPAATTFTKKTGGVKRIRKDEIIELK